MKRYNTNEPRRYIGPLPSPEAIAFINQLRKTRMAERLTFLGHNTEPEDVPNLPEERAKIAAHEAWLKRIVPGTEVE